MAIAEPLDLTETAKKDLAAKELAKRNYDLELGLVHVFRLNSNVETEAQPTEPIKLLLVNEATVSSGVLPLHFGPAPEIGIPYPSIIIEVIPDEYEMIKNNQIKLPWGWKIMEELPKEIDAREG